MRVIIAGSSGMVGREILNLCLDSERITHIVSLVRKPSGLQNQKLTEVIHKDFENYNSVTEHFKDLYAAYFCIGAYTGQVKDDLFKKITVDFAVRFAEAVKQNSPNARLCLLSGAGADRTEKSRTSFARYKGMAENQIDGIGLSWHSFRPGYIYPVTPRKEPNVMYTISRWLYPLLKLFGKNASIKSTELALAMFQIGIKGSDKTILENKEIIDSLKSSSTPQ